MANIENSEIIIHDTAKTIEFVKSNWSDPLGNQYVCWLEHTLGKIKHIERRRDMMRLKAEKITLLCEQIASSDDDQPKVLKKTR